MEKSGKDTVELPEPSHDGGTSLERAILNRRSERSFSDESISLSGISQLLWAAQGETGRRGFRTVPSAGALYPLEILVAAGQVEGLEPGVYRYLPESHALKPEISGDRRNELWAAGLRQTPIKQAPAVFVFAAVFERTTQKYGQRGRQYVFMEAGHAAQNLCLQAVGLELDTVTIGAFDDRSVAKAAGLDKNETPVYILPAGKSR